MITLSFLGRVRMEELEEKSCSVWDLEKHTRSLVVEGIGGKGN